MKVRKLLVVFTVSALLTACGQQAEVTPGTSETLGTVQSMPTEETGTLPSSQAPEQNNGDITPPQAPTILPEYEALYLQNPDLVGWITIPGTMLDYPVVQTPDRPNYYLHRGFDGEEAYEGTLYVREQCDVNLPSDNVTIYGHNMADGSMFGSLHKYKEKAHWQANPLIEFNTLYERHTYEICLIFRTSVNISGGFDYHLFDTAENAEAFDSFIATCQSKALYDTGITPVYGDKLITLSTCDRSIASGRLVVVARRIS